MNAVVESQKETLASLCQRFRVHRLELFGSAVGERFDPERSDLDFLVVFEPSTPEEHADCYFGLLAALQDLFGRQIDLVEYSAIQNPYFLEDVETSRTPLYGA